MPSTQSIISSSYKLGCAAVALAFLYRLACFIPAVLQLALRINIVPRNLLQLGGVLLLLAVATYAYQQVTQPTEASKPAARAAGQGR